MAIEFLKAGDTSWTVPAGVTSVKVHAIGCGTNGTFTTTNAANNRWGGSSGAYSVVNALPVTPGTSCFCNVPAGNALTDTWFNKTSNVAPTSTADGVLADSGIIGINGTAGSATGGLAANCIGDSKSDGANGGKQSSGGAGSGGGAGSAGPGGVGRTGGQTSSSGHGGGSGCNGGSSTTATATGSTTGATGGLGPLGTGGGAGGATSTAGTAGTAGTGGGGGGGGSSSTVSGNGAQYTIWTATAGTYSGQTAGPGGGGAGGNTTCGNGGGFGAGGGASKASLGAVGLGAAGILVIEYTPAFAPPPMPTTGFQALLAR